VHVACTVRQCILYKQRTKFGSIGPNSGRVRDACRPGISRLFHWRLVLRVGEMLQAIRRGVLPGVVAVDKDKVKTKGSTVWGGAGKIRRLFDVRPATEYSRSGWQAGVTLLEGSKGRAADRVADDVDVVATLKGDGPVLAAGMVQQLVSESEEFLGECRRELRGAVPRGRKRSRAEVASAEVADSSHSSGHPVEAAAPVGGGAATSWEAVLERAGQSDVSAGGSSVGSAGDCESDATVSEADTRSVQTDDSWESETSAAVTDPDGFSPDLRESDELEAEQSFGDSDGTHSAGCTEGED